MATVTRNILINSSVSGSSSLATTSGTLVGILGANQSAIVTVCIHNYNSAGGAIALRNFSAMILYNIPISQTGSNITITGIYIGPGDRLTFTSDNSNAGVISASGVIYQNT